MGALTTAGKNAGLDALAAATTLYMAPFNGDPTSGGSEVSSSFTEGRQLVEFDVATGGLLSNTNDETWTATAGVTVTHIALYDADTAGTLLGSHELADSAVMVAIDTLDFPAGNVNIVLTD